LESIPGLPKNLKIRAPGSHLVFLLYQGVIYLCRFVYKAMTPCDRKLLKFLSVMGIQKKLFLRCIATKNESPKHAIPERLRERVFDTSTIIQTRWQTKAEEIPWDLLKEKVG
jgi:hypothetical protein